MAFELPKGVGDFIQGFEIVWREHFSLDDGKVNFDLIEPTAVNGSMDQMQTGVTLLEPLDTGRSAMRGTIVHNPEHAAGLGIVFRCREITEVRGGFSSRSVVTPLLRSEPEVA